MRSALSIVMVLIAFLVCGPAFADNRVALVIGNGAYQNAPTLPNPVNDANDTAAALRRLGFDVTLLNDATFEDMRKALREFTPKAQHADIATVYFAGHGLEIRDQNWLLPVDANLKLDIDAGQEAISLNNIVPIVSNSRKLGLIILDACRDNPFLTSMQSSLPGRSLGYRGLAPVDPPGSVLIVFAAKHGTSAEDGSGRNSPFTSALLKNIETPGLEVNYLFRNVHDDVLNATGQKQEPYLYGSLSKDPVYFKPPLSQPAVAAEQPNDAAQAWSEVKDTQSVAILTTFINHYDGTFYADLARARRDELASGAASAASPMNAQAAVTASPRPASAPAGKPATPPAAPSTKVASLGPVSAPAQDPSTFSDDELMGEWSFSAHCGLLGNWHGDMQITSISGGNFSGIISDPLNGTQRVGGRLKDGHFSFSRRLLLSTQYASGMVRRSGSGLRINAAVTDGLVSCPVVGVKD